MELLYEFYIEVSTQQKWKHPHTKTCTRMFTAALLVRAKKQNHSNVCWLMKRWIKCGMALQWIVTWQEKRCYNVDECLFKALKLSERSWLGKPAHSMRSPQKANAQGKSDESLSRARGWKVRRSHCEWLWASFWDNGSALKWGRRKQGNCLRR